LFDGFANAHIGPAAELLPDISSSISASVGRGLPASSAVNENIANLQAKAVRNETAAAMQTVAEVISYELTKATVLISCSAPEPTVTKLVCAGGLMKVAIDTVNIANGQILNNSFKSYADQAKQQASSLQKELESLKQKLKDKDVPENNKRAADIFIGLCQTIKDEC
jgi:hypothetical protein